MHMTILSIGTLGLLWSQLDIDMDVRGANGFVRPFHALGLAATVTIAALVFHILLRFGRSVLGHRPAFQALLYMLCVLVVWFFGLPFGDYLAETWERAHKTAAEVGDTGYGWYYWDDSGMGNWRMSLLSVVGVAVVIPIVPILWTVFSYCVLKARCMNSQIQDSAA